MELDNLIKACMCCIDDECTECPLRTKPNCLSVLPKETIEALGKLTTENKQLRNDLIMQMALAQNGQSAIETNKQLTKRLNAAIEDLERALWDDEVCIYCKHYYVCEDNKCDCYIEDIDMIDEKGDYYDWRWSCRDWDWGTCVKLENTPCNGCDLINHFEWRGIRDEC